MKRYLYLSLIPESLIASQLSPEDFGNYYAVGSKKRSRGQAIFFEVDASLKSDYFKMEDVERRCVAHDDGSPRRSIYLGIYRVLEHIPLSAIGKLYLATGDGRVLALSPQEYVSTPSRENHLYQELCPVTPRIISKLDPLGFCRSITSPDNAVSVHTIVFCELLLKRLSRDPDANDVEDLPYRNLGHLRDCIRELDAKPDKMNKAVNRGLGSDLLYRTVKDGFFIGNQEDMLYYPMPTLEQLEREYYEWWRSAQNAFGE